MRISYSSLETYRNCPLKYRYKEIDKLKEPKSKEAVFGTLVHSTMKFIYDPALIPPTIEQALDHFSRGWNSEIWENELEERAAFSQGIEMIQKYYRSNDPREATIVALESNFSLEISDPLHPRETHTIRGIIDRIDKTEDGYEIIDYKTSKKMPSQDFVDNNLQLSIYLKAFLTRYPKEVENIANITVSLYFLKHGVKLSSTRTLEDLQEVDNLFLEVIGLIEAGEFDAHVSPLCDWCGFQKVCPMWKHKFKEERKIDSTEINRAIEDYIATKRELTLQKLRVMKLQETIMNYMDQEDVERVFGGDGIVERAKRISYKYDPEKIRSFLEPMEKWESVLKLDPTALKRTLASFPKDMQKEIDSASKIIDKESTSLKVKKGGMSTEEDGGLE
ncbi:MAG: PD-(D/E)XK nuclease family protein [Candidatus Moranbacteria bacterium]|nr:PD-(D/E)XK nuclease family protein [Candidatus Moranbacteria bacterium]